MTRLVYIPNRIIDHNGIADGATVYVYLTGTTTPISIYSDSLMTVPMANPFTVAAGAIFPNVYYDPSNIIKLKIVSALDGSIDQTDPYNPISVGVTTNAVAFNNGGAGAASGSTFDGSSGITISFNSVGAAPLASPTFTGVPAAPTAAPGTNSTQLATTAFVTAAIPSLGTYAPLASPTFTGSPAGPTAALGTATTQLATTAFVDALRDIPQNAQTAAYQLALTDRGRHVSITTGGITVPANASVAFPIGSTIGIYNNSGASQNIAITTDTMTLAGTATTGTRSLAQHGWATLIKVATTSWVISGAGVS